MSKKALVLGLLLMWAPTPSKSGAATPVVAETLAEVACPSESETKSKFALVRNVFDNQPKTSFGNLIIVLAVERTTTSPAKGKVRIWQNAGNSLKGAYPVTRVSGALMCPDAGGRMLLFVGYSNAIWWAIDAYEVGAESKGVATRLPTHKMLKEELATEGGRPQAVAAVSAMVPLKACGLDRMEAADVGGKIMLTLSPRGRECYHYALSFDPLKKQFTDIPKEWELQ